MKMKKMISALMGWLDQGWRQEIQDTPIRKYAAEFGGEMLWKPAGSATCPRNEHTDTIGVCPDSDIIYGDPEYTRDQHIESQRIVKKRRAGEVCLNSTKNNYFLVKRPKDEQSSQKDGYCNVPRERSSVTHPTFCGQYLLDIQARLSYTHCQ